MQHNMENLFMKAQFKTNKSVKPFSIKVIIPDKYNSGTREIKTNSKFA